MLSSSAIATQFQLATSIAHDSTKNPIYQTVLGNMRSAGLCIDKEIATQTGVTMLSEVVLRAAVSHVSQPKPIS